MASTFTWSPTAPNPTSSSSSRVRKPRLFTPITPTAGLGSHAGGYHGRLVDGPWRWVRSCAWYFSGGAEDAERSTLRPRRGGADEGWPPVVVQRLSDGLERGPLRLCRQQAGQSNAREPILVAEVGDHGQCDLPAPEIAGQALLWRQYGLCEVSVPLGPGGCLAVGEVESVDHCATLPAIVCRVRRLIINLAASGNVAPPGARQMRRINVQQLYGA